MPDVDACAICAGKSKGTALTRDGFENQCPRCGKFEITGTAAALEKTPDLRRKLSGWVHGRNRDGIVPLITSDTLARMASLRLPSIAERAERLLLEAVLGQERLDSRINLDEPRFVAATYSWDIEETRVLRQLLKRRGWIETVAYGPRGAATASTMRSSHGSGGRLSSWPTSPSKSRVCTSRRALRWA